MAPFISVIIPNRNGVATIDKCLAAVFSSGYPDFEVIVVDDGSEDNSVAVIRTFPCELLRLEKHSGAARARNVGAAHSKGEALFFTDADCLLQEDTLSIASKTLAGEGPTTVVGGTYTRTPYDKRFFSRFQSVFIHYSETKNADHPDYVATHAMVIDARTFRKNNGFAEAFLPILEDVEFSHRLRRAGYTLVVHPELQVQHVFNYSFLGSLRNAVKKSLYWTIYSLGNGDLLADSGAASLQLKLNVGAYVLSALLLLLAFPIGRPFLLPLIPGVILFNLVLNRGLIRALYRTGGAVFAAGATLYYVMVYPLAVGTGALLGALRYLAMPKRARPA
ncbi:MAG: glycosyltransferase family 2 protein [Candidatus Rokubacteria bacterium]|nr:glycosyltransferase family 2 protein [Candidatus Rokubacteria bacterium]